MLSGLNKSTYSVARNRSGLWPSGLAEAEQKWLRSEIPAEPASNPNHTHFQETQPQSYKRKGEPVGPDDSTHRE